MGEVVQNHNTIDHVGKNGGEWTTLDGHGDDSATGATADGPLDADDAGRAAKAGGDEAVATGDGAEKLCRLDEEGVRELRRFDHGDIMPPGCHIAFLGCPAWTPASSTPSNSR